MNPISKHAIAYLARRSFLAAGLGLILVTFAGADVARAHGGPMTVHRAAQLGDLEKLAAFLDANPALLELRDANKQTPLLAACFGRAPAPVLQFLIERGADIHVTGPKQETALHLVSRTLRADAARVLLVAGANANAVNDRGQTPLHLAALMGLSLKSESLRREALTKVLLSAGADLTLTDQDGMTPLHRAAARGRVRMAMAILDHLSGRDGDTASARASSDASVRSSSAGGHAAASSRADSPSATDSKWQDKNAALLSRLLKIRDKQGRTVLHRAAEAGRAALVETLIRAGAEADAIDEHGLTPLHIAAQHLRLDVVTALLAANADANAVSASGQTPLIAMAALRRGHRNVDPLLIPLAQTLLAAGADPKRTDEHHLSAEDYARQESLAGLIAVLRGEPVPAMQMQSGATSPR